jgi:hypothetical protein
MSANGTKREFSSEHFQAGNSTYCRPPGLSVGLLPNTVEKVHFHSRSKNFRAVQEQLQFLAERVAKFRLLPCGVR